jgi:hypothetical protein
VRAPRLALAVLYPALAAACATAPRPTAGARRIAANPPAIVEGRVENESGVPVVGISVRGIPRGADIPWSSPAETGCDGNFRLSLAAPGSYGFLLEWKGTAVITSLANDPAFASVDVAPGQTFGGVSLVLLAAEWQQITGAAPEDTPSCP